MKCQSLFSVKKRKKNIINLSSTEYANRVVKNVREKTCSYCHQENMPI